jgi:hypothetical protein
LGVEDVGYEPLSGTLPGLGEPPNSHVLASGADDRTLRGDLPPGRRADLVRDAEAADRGLGAVTESEHEHDPGT